MELVPFKPAAGALAEAGSGAGAGSIPAMVAAQQEMLHEQVDQLQRLVVAQCRLTGVNPLAQEMVSRFYPLMRFYPLLLLRFAHCMLLTWVNFA